MVDLKELMRTMEQTEQSCDLQCDKCPMYLPSRDECFHSAQKKWQEWNKQQKEHFEKVLRGEE